MKICILGWYGTETIGDRAILAGIISLLKNSFNNIEINLGSLYPFYSKRMLNEDKQLYKILTKTEININLFNSMSKVELRRNIDNSDIVIIGGGPLMDLGELFILKYAFKYAEKNNKRRYIYGCGIGPLFKEKYIKCVLDIINLSNKIILRDSVSKEYLIELADRFNFNISEKNFYVGFDPAVECAVKYKKYLIENNIDKDNNIVINLREFPLEYSKNNKSDVINKLLITLIDNISLKNKIKMIPMHYFYVGNDDRYFLSKIKFNVNNKENCIVQNKPLSLSETMLSFYKAELSIGMRFHSVVLQTILNGNNIILDYTEPNKGKIYGFLKDIDEISFYRDRYWVLQNIKTLNFESIENIRKLKNKLPEFLIEKYYEKNKKVYMDFNMLIFNKV